MQLTPYQRDILTRTVLGEALNESPEGQAAIVHVILNRASDGRWPSDPAKVALQRNKKGTYQFTAWSPKYGNKNVYIRSGPLYDRVAQIVDQVAAGVIPDPTGGAIGYWNERLASPKWGPRLARENDHRIGNHRFVGKTRGAVTATAYADQPTSTRAPFNAVMGKGLPLLGVSTARRTFANNPAAVKEWQTYLHDVGLYDGKVDGIFGSKTGVATAAFQAKHNAKLVDGIVGPETRGIAARQKFGVQGEMTAPPKNLGVGANPGATLDNPPTPQASPLRDWTQPGMTMTSPAYNEGYNQPMTVRNAGTVPSPDQFDQRFTTPAPAKAIEPPDPTDVTSPAASAAENRYGANDQASQLAKSTREVQAAATKARQKVQPGARMANRYGGVDRSWWQGVMDQLGTFGPTPVRVSAPVAQSGSAPNMPETLTTDPPPNQAKEPRNASFGEILAQSAQAQQLMEPTRAEAAAPGMASAQPARDAQSIAQAVAEVANQSQVNQQAQQPSYSTGAGTLGQTMAGASTLAAPSEIGLSSLGALLAQAQPDPSRKSPENTVAQMMAVGM